MKKISSKSLLLIAFVSVIFQLSSQAQQWDWAKKIVPVGNDSRVEVLAIDAYGSDYYLTGRFIGSVQYTDPVFNSVRTATSSSIYTTDLFVARANSSGRIYWFSAGGSSQGEDQGNDIVALSSGKVVITGFIGKDDYSYTNQATFNSSLPATATVNAAIYANHNKKAFVACYSMTTGTINWVAGLEDPVNTESTITESEGRGIAKDPTAGDRFFVTGYFKGHIQYGQYNNAAGTQNCTAQCIGSFYPYNDSTVPDTSSNQYNTYVMQYYTTGCSNWFTQLKSGGSDAWNIGQDIVAYEQDGVGDFLYLIGQFHGELNQDTYNPYTVTNTATGLTGYHQILSTNDQQAGYILKLGYSGGGWGTYGYPAACKPVYGLIAWNYNANSPIYNAEKIEGGIVVMESVSLRSSGSSDAVPVVVGEWFDHTIPLPTLQANHQGSPRTVTNGSLTGYYTDVFTAQYPGDLLSCNWVTSISGDLDDRVGGPGATLPYTPFYIGESGACAVTYNSNGEIMLTGGFTGACTVNSTSIGGKSLRSSSGNASDVDMYVVKYDVNGDAVYAENIMSACAGIDDYGTAVVSGSYGGAGGSYAGYSTGDIGFNKLCPATEFNLNQATANSSMSYYGKHNTDECFSQAITVTPLTFPTPVPSGKFRVRRVAGASSANVDYNLPPGAYVIAYRNPTISNTYNCLNGSTPNWSLAPLTIAFPGGAGSILVGFGGVGPALTSATYEWFIESKCASGRWGVIDTANKTLKKNEHNSALDNAGAGIKIYPNPSKGLVDVKIEEANVSQMNIMDYTGRVMKTYTSNEIGSRMDVSFLSNGVYIVVFKNGDEVVATEKLSILK